MVELRNDQRRVRLPTVRLRQEAQRVLKALGLGGRTLSILLTDDRRIAGLHERWMGEEGPTDVMSFPYSEVVQAGTPCFAECPETGPPPVLGDVVISTETAARRKPADVSGEVRRYLIHGILHLAGYDHRTKQQRQQMNRLTRTLLRRVP